MDRMRETRLLLRALLWSVGVALSGATLAAPAALADAAADIRGVIGKTWDKPAAKVETDPVVVAGDYAVASWSQGHHGGRALMRRSEAGWSVVLCAGDGIKDAAGLVAAGVPQSEAARLAAALETAEAAVAPERRALFSLFGKDGMDAKAPDHGGKHQGHEH